MPSKDGEADKFLEQHKKALGVVVDFQKVKDLVGLCAEALQPRAAELTRLCQHSDTLQIILNDKLQACIEQQLSMLMEKAVLAACKEK